MKRYLVLFRSHSAPPVDITVVDVTSTSPLAAVREAKREVEIQHPWAMVTVVPWPSDCLDIEEAVRQYAS